MTPPTIKKCPTCLQFKDFEQSISNDKVYLNTAQSVLVTCPSGSQATVPLPAGIISYVSKFTIGNPPYPNITLNCTGGAISIPVPDNATQADLDALIIQVLNTCASQIAESIGCSEGTFFNTLQIYNGCPANLEFSHVVGALPAGVVGQSTAGDSDPTALMALPGAVTSTISVADANAKALQVLNEIYNTGQIQCSCT
jgi:hypothetical protein